KTNLDNLTHRDIHQLQFIINNTPRKCLGFLTPHEALHKALHFNCESTFAHEQAWGRRWKGSRLERHSTLRDYVLKNLAMGLSPEQIAGRMRLEKHSIRI